MNTADRLMGWEAEIAQTQVTNCSLLNMCAVPCVMMQSVWGWGRCDIFAIMQFSVRASSLETKGLSIIGKRKINNDIESFVFDFNT